ncbi:unnamed protein product [Paramecium sonneborni]|uniref:Uncharacterized protein n=1 Tax=Paramecium sonneborni TaxID=65129 RepID=A0A8S1MX79_9CILI|nr:unnamed protein product [Paramecium sonneborni]
MSEFEQLTQQQLSILQNQEMLSNWISLKKNLSSKFKSFQEAFKALKKDGKESLTAEDFQEYSKGLDLSLLFKDVELNEANFGRVWENWEYKQKQNEHKLQIINEKLKLLAMLDDKEKIKEIKTDVISNKNISKLASDCESLSQLQEKLDTLVEEGQKQKSKLDVFQDEQDCISICFLKKNEEKQQGDLYINKLQLKSDEDAGKSQQPANKIMKSYIDGQTNHFRSKTGLNSNMLIQNGLSNRSSLSNNIKSYKQSYIKEPLLQTSPQKGSYTVRVQPQQIQQENQQQKIKSPYEEKQQEERKSHKINRMKGDLQQYISQLFFHEKEFRQNNIINHRPLSSEEQKGLVGFMNFKQYFKNQQEKPSFIEPEDSITQKRFQNIRYKLDDFQQQKLSQYNYITKTQPNFSPDKAERDYNQKVPINLSNKLNTKYSPGNTNRLNLEYLKQEKEFNNKQIQDQQIESQVLE